MARPAGPGSDPVCSGFTCYAFSMLPSFHPAMLYERLPGGSVHCRLCAHGCRIAEGGRGICRVRENRGGSLGSLVYGRVIAEHDDPIEKKPLFHFLPGTRSWSIATAGCNLSCRHCQNWEISLAAPRLDPIPGAERSPAEVVEAALAAGCRSVSYTYTEPTVFLEFALDCAREARKRGLANVFVSNGFMSPEAREAAAPWIDAANIDLKGATEEHYRAVCGARLAPVKETIADLRSRGVWLEVTTLLIPGLNDDPASLQSIAGFIAGVDPLIPWHISRFFPTHLMTGTPQTPLASLERAVEAGKRGGLRHVYPGNIRGMGEETLCHACGEPLLRRMGFGVADSLLTIEGGCPRCGEKFNGVLINKYDKRRESSFYKK
jgi:pyruvate formate lyase activating enzyme